MVGAGPAGLAFASVAAERGHDVTLFEASHEIGGQFNVAKKIPGKEEFHETLRYFKRRLDQTGVKIRLNHRATADELTGFDEVVLATGIAPRMPAIEGIDHPKVLNYLDVLKHEKPVGKSVAIIGAGGIGFDTAEYLTSEGTPTSLDTDAFLREWGIDKTLTERGGLAAQGAKPHASPRQVWLLQRKASKVGDGLGKTTGWVHRQALKMKQVEMISSVQYDKIDDAGLHIRIKDQPQVLPVDNVIICAGQDPLRELEAALKAAGKPVHLIGGADVAAELDAKRAINQGSRLAAGI